MIEDALVAIILVEESMAFVSGVSILGFKSLKEDQENVFVLFGRERDHTGGRIPDVDEVKYMSFNLRLLMHDYLLLLESRN